MHTHNYLLKIAKRNNIDVKALNDDKRNCKKKVNNNKQLKQRGRNKYNSDENNLFNNNQFGLSESYSNSYKCNNNNNNNKNSFSSSFHIRNNNNNQLNYKSDEHFKEGDRYNSHDGNNEIPFHINSESVNENNNVNNVNDVPVYCSDPRLSYTMNRLGLDSLTHILESNGITFNDLLFLTKEDLNDLNFHMFQKNRILNFINEFQKISQDYSEEEIEKFFNSNPKYNLLIGTSQMQ